MLSKEEVKDLIKQAEDANKKMRERVKTALLKDLDTTIKKQISSGDFTYSPYVDEHCEKFFNLCSFKWNVYAFIEEQNDEETTTLKITQEDIINIKEELTKNNIDFTLTNPSKNVYQFIIKYIIEDDEDNEDNKGNEENS